jgi:uncharacterized protein with HEPN domain
LCRYDSDPDYLDYLRDIFDAIEHAQDFVEGVDYDLFITDHKTNFSVVRALEIVGEAAKNILQPIRQQYPEVPWRDLTGMRDKLAHDYSGVNLRVVWNTVVDDLPILKDQIHRIIQAYETEIRDDNS